MDIPGRPRPSRNAVPASAVATSSLQPTSTTHSPAPSLGCCGPPCLLQWSELSPRTVSSHTAPSEHLIFSCFFIPFKIEDVCSSTADTNSSLKHRLANVRGPQSLQHCLRPSSWTQQPRCVHHDMVFWRYGLIYSHLPAMPSSLVHEHVHGHTHPHHVPPRPAPCATNATCGPKKGMPPPISPLWTPLAVLMAGKFVPCWRCPCQPLQPRPGHQPQLLVYQQIVQVAMHIGEGGYT